MSGDLNGPAMQPPPGQTSDFVNTGAEHLSGYIWLTASAVISTIAVMARVVSSIVAKKFMVEDYLMIAALGIFSGMLYVSWQLITVLGMWCHQWNVQMKDMANILYLLHLATVFYGPIAMCIKVAILTNWLRIFVPRGQRNYIFWVLHSMIWANVISYIVGTFTEVFRCWPREKIWNMYYEDGSCHIDVDALYFATSVINFLSDTTILIIPQWMIWKLTMSKKRKWGLSLLFTIGLGAWTFGIIRIVYLVQLASSEDATYAFSGMAVWTIWEVTTGFLIMGIPAFPRAFKVLPGSEAIITFFRSLTSKTDLSKSLPFRHMYKPRTRRRRSVFEISELETHGLGSTDSPELDRSTSHQSVGVEPERDVERQQLETV